MADQLGLFDERPPGPTATEALVRTQRRPRLRLDRDAYPGGVPHVRGSDTSREAAVQARSFAGTVRGRVLEAIQGAGDDGMTDDEIEALLHLRHQTASARRRELVRGGFVRDSGERRKTRSGCSATVWVAVPEEEYGLHTAEQREAAIRDGLRAAVARLDVEDAAALLARLQEDDDA